MMLAAVLLCQRSIVLQQKAGISTGMSCSLLQQVLLLVVSHATHYAYR